MNDSSRTSSKARAVESPLIHVMGIGKLLDRPAIAQHFGQWGEVSSVQLIRRKSAKDNHATVQYCDPSCASMVPVDLPHIIQGRPFPVMLRPPNRTVFVAKIPRSMRAIGLRALAEPLGPVESASIIKNHKTTQSKGCGFIKFVTREAAVKALKRLRHDHPRWIVEWATSLNDPEILGLDRSTLYVANLHPSGISKEDLKERFAAYGEIINVSMVDKQYPEEGHVRIDRYAFVKFRHERDAAAAMESENGAVWHQKSLRVQYCESPSTKERRRSGLSPNTQPWYPSQIAAPLTYNTPPVMTRQHPMMMMMRPGHLPMYPQNPSMMMMMVHEDSGWRDPRTPSGLWTPQSAQHQPPQSVASPTWHSSPEATSMGIHSGSCEPASSSSLRPRALVAEGHASPFHMHTPQHPQQQHLHPLYYPQHPMPMQPMFFPTYEHAHIIPSHLEQASPLFVPPPQHQLHGVLSEPDVAADLSHSPPRAASAGPSTAVSSPEHAASACTSLTTSPNDTDVASGVEDDIVITTTTCTTATATEEKFFHHISPE